MNMPRTPLGYGFVLIGTYLVVAHATDAGKLLTRGFDGSAKLVTVLQGRGKA